MNLAKVSKDSDDFSRDSDDFGELIIRGYSPMGSIVGMEYASAQVEAREGLIPARHISTQSIRVELNSGGDYPQTSYATINHDNVDRLLSAIGQLELANVQSDRFKFTELEFEVDGLKIIVFNNEKGKLMFAISAELVTIHFNSLSKLGELRKLIVAARNHLDSTRVV